MIEPGQIWMRDPEMKIYWGDAAGKLVIIISILDDNIRYRYISWYNDESDHHHVGEYSRFSFLRKFKLYKDV